MSLLPLPLGVSALKNRRCSGLRNVLVEGVREMGILGGVVLGGPGAGALREGTGGPSAPPSPRGHRNLSPLQGVGHGKKASD